MRKREFLRWVAATAAAPVAAGAAAQGAAAGWPARPLRVIVPFGAGGTSDIAARLVGEGLSARLGQPVLVENRAGVSGVLGTEYVARAPADGYTVLLTSIGPTAFAPSTPKQLSYDPLRDFTHVGLIGSTPLVLVVNNEFSPRTVDALIQTARSNPGKINFGSSGPASPSHVMLERFKTRFDLSIEHIPFRQGTPATLNEVIAGRVQGSFDSLPALMTMIRAGRVRPLAVTASQRHPLLPEVPTLAEAGYADLMAVSWFGLALPSATPAEIAHKLNDELNLQLRRDEVRSRLQELSFATTTMSLEEMRRFVADEIDRWRTAVQAAKITFS